MKYNNIHKLIYIIKCVIYIIGILNITYSIKFFKCLNLNSIG